ncbi:helix-turn-helix domain-containing protein [Streptacidiphilus rugosus]|uniref:helix-turn-helix domain-containing protein n=1 Tax=Streptacidiphilus rugosus TaxID=405783 RepID=UPI0006901695|nr:helix-turn-helix domain-containing protein [Streptacidiphilus rugosus]
MSDDRSASPDENPVHVETDQQLHAIGSLMRHRVLRVLRDGPATVTQIATRLGIAKGSSNYHVKVLAKAGLIKVVDTRKVRGVTELYYGMAGKGIHLPESGPGQPDILMRHALADVESAPAGAEKDERLKHLRLSPEHFALAVEKVIALHEEITALHDPTQPAADLFTAFYRPLDTRPADPNEPSSTENGTATT